MTAHGTEYEAQPEQMLAVAGDIADTLARVDAVIGQLRRTSLHASALGRLGSPVAMAGKHVHSSLERNLTMSHAVLDDARLSVELASKKYTDADNYAASANRALDRKVVQA